MFHCFRLTQIPGLTLHNQPALTKFGLCEYHLKHVNNIQLSPDGEVNSGENIPRGETSRYTPTLRGIVVLVFTKLSWIKMKKVTFCK